MLAPAKLNLFLHVTGKREDGYHLLESLMIPLSIGDEVRVGQSDKLELQITGPFAATIANSYDNIVLKAAQLLAEKAGRKPDVKIALEKNIPVGAGLGGGSADAAAVLKLLNDLWQLGFSTEKLMEIGLELGADVPFCVMGKPALVTGIGEVIKPVDKLPDLNILLVNPNKHLSTPEVFKYEPIIFSDELGLTIPKDITEFIDLLQKQHNALEANAVSIIPDIAEVLSIIGQQDGCLLARMSGSGATCFGIFNNKASLEMALGAIKKGNPGWWVADN
ncbi:MAG: ispE [Rickettsiaceae bacterium]|jgi:4-diphosphocytidyl-2-C-methyl-D-erythritol kinase|nr:ispE [Rickettsiaceae bacterium]